MIKDNHIAVAGGISAAVRQARARAPTSPAIEVETDTLTQVQEGGGGGCRRHSARHMSPATAREAVALVAGRAIVEVSGGVTLETLADYAAAGAQVISTSAITAAARRPDLGLDFLGRP